MLLCAEGPGDVDWCVDEGAVVTQGQLLAFLNPPERCGSRRLLAPVAGQLTARRSRLWRAVAPGEPLAVLSGAPSEVRALRQAERAGLSARLVELGDGSGPLRAALVAPERRAVLARLAELDAASP